MPIGIKELSASFFFPSLLVRRAYIELANSRSNYLKLIPESKFQKTFDNNIKQEEINNRESSKKRTGETLKYGINRKDDNYTSLKIIAAGETEPSITFDQFFIQNVTEVSQEKYQLIETFGETVVFFFGERPKIYRYSGTLLNTKDYPWKEEWIKKYADNMRGTRCVENGSRAYLTYDYTLREGYLLSFSSGQISAKPNDIDFNFTLFVTREINLDLSKNKSENTNKKNTPNQIVTLAGDLKDIFVNQYNAYMNNKNKEEPHIKSSSAVGLATADKVAPKKFLNGTNTESHARNVGLKNQGKSTVEKANDINEKIISTNKNIDKLNLEKRKLDSEYALESIIRTDPNVPTPRQKEISNRLNEISNSKQDLNNKKNTLISQKKSILTT